MAFQDDIELEGIWLYLYCIVAFFFLRWFLFSPSSPANFFLASTSLAGHVPSSDGNNDDGGSPGYRAFLASVRESNSRPRPPPLIDPRTILLGTGKPVLSMRATPPAPRNFSGSDPRKPLVAERHWPKPSDELRKPLVAESRRWEASAAAVATPTGEQYAASLATLSAALRRPSSGPLSLSQGFWNSNPLMLQQQKPLDPSLRPPTAPLNLDRLYPGQPRLSGAEHRRWLHDFYNPPARRPVDTLGFPARPFQERAVPPSPLISLAPYSRPVERPKQRFFL